MRSTGTCVRDHKSVSPPKCPWSSLECSSPERRTPSGNPVRRSVFRLNISVYLKHERVHLRQISRLRGAETLYVYVVCQAVWKMFAWSESKTQKLFLNAERVEHVIGSCPLNQNLDRSFDTYRGVQTKCGCVGTGVCSPSAEFTYIIWRSNPARWFSDVLYEVYAIKGRNLKYCGILTVSNLF